MQHHKAAHEIDAGQYFFVSLRLDGFQDVRTDHLQTIFQTMFLDVLFCKPDRVCTDINANPSDVWIALAERNQASSITAAKVSNLVEREMIQHLKQDVFHKRMMVHVGPKSY